jgi:hypothetical protein
MFAVFGAVLWFIIKWTLIIAWRFFSGAHMNGELYNDSTWWKDASKKYQKVRKKYTWWKRKSRMKRAGWRHAIFWPCLILSVGFAVDPWGMAFVIGMLSPGLYFLGRQRVMLWFFIPVAGTHSDGITYQHWIMKPTFRNLLDKFKPDHLRKHKKYPGLLRDIEFRESEAKRMKVEDIPLEYANAVRAEVLDSFVEQPPIELKLLLDPEVDMIE